ncbi:MAG TPA: hypothetical protein VN632_03230 [Stellaceae bacterium]|nr:hypothetical protein [Stellaceae bacterium]
MIPRAPQILNASTNLVGICFVIIGSLALTDRSRDTWADEIAWLALACLFTATLTSYFAIRGDAMRWPVVIADAAFIGGVVALMASLIAAAIQL